MKLPRFTHGKAFTVVSHVALCTGPVISWYWHSVLSKDETEYLLIYYWFQKPGRFQNYCAALQEDVISCRNYVNG